MERPAIPAPKHCGSYRPGHEVHHVQAIRSAEDLTPSRSGCVVAIEGEVIEVRFEDGEIARYRHHDTARLRAEVAASHSGVTVKDRWSLLHRLLPSDLLQQIRVFFLVEGQHEVEVLTGLMGIDLRHWGVEVLPLDMSSPAVTCPPSSRSTARQAARPKEGSWSTDSGCDASAICRSTSSIFCTVVTTCKPYGIRRAHTGRYHPLHGQ